MLSRLRNMFRVADLRNKILFTLVIVAVYRLGAHLPVPYVDFAAIQDLQDQADEHRRRRLPRPVLRRRDHERRDLLPRDHAVHHGVDHHAAARRGDPEARAVAARGSDRSEEDHPVDPLPHGRRSRSSSRPGSSSPCTRASSGLLGFAGLRGHATSSPSSTRRARRSSCSRWTAGTALVMWLGELITQRGIGNGMSILIFASVVSTLPAQGGADLQRGQQVPVLHDHRHRRSR